MYEKVYLRHTYPRLCAAAAAVRRAHTSLITNRQSDAHTIATRALAQLLEQSQPFGMCGLNSAGNSFTKRRIMRVGFDECVERSIEISVTRRQPAVSRRALSTQPNCRHTNSFRFMCTDGKLQTKH